MTENQQQQKIEQIQRQLEQIKSEQIDIAQVFFAFIVPFADIVICLVKNRIAFIFVLIVLYLLEIILCIIPVFGWLAAISIRITVCVKVAKGSINYQKFLAILFLVYGVIGGALILIFERM